MLERRTEGKRCVTFPSGNFISPGFIEVQTVREDTIERFHIDGFIEEWTEKVHESHGVNIPDPGINLNIVEDGDAMPERGSFMFEDKTFTVVRDDDWGFWGWFTSGEPRTKEDWLNNVVRHSAKAGIQRGADRGWWDIDANGDPQRPATKISISDMQAQNKPLMAHLMHDLGFFPSVGQARKNGWDKPLELGRHELGPRKKRAIVEIIP